MPAQLTSAVQRQGLKNALICGIVVLVLWLALTVALTSLTERPLIASLATSLALIWGTTFPLLVGIWLYSLSTRGPVLLDCGAHPHRRRFLAIAVIALLAGLSGGLSATPNLFFGPPFALSFAAFWLIVATGRLQVRQNGLWCYWSLLRWQKIRSYHWEPDASLMLRATSVLSLPGGISVPPHHREQFEALFLKHLSQARGSAA